MTGDGCGILLRASVVLINPDDAVSVSVQCGGGPGSISWYDIFTVAQSGTIAVEPSVGDRVTISIYHDRHALKDSFTATDLSTGVSSTVVKPVSQAWVWTMARVMGGGPTSRSARTDTRLWSFKNTRLTSYNGTRGTLLGRWPSYRAIGTSTGTSTGTVVLRPTYPWNNARNFGVWWRAAR